MATLTNTKIKDTYDGLLKTTDNDVIGASEKNITDGLGNASVLSIGTGSASFSDNVSITGSLTASNAVTAGTVSVGDAIVHTGDTDTKIEFINNQIKTTLGGTLEINSTITGTIFYKDIEVNGLTIGKGANDVSTNTALGYQALDNATGAGNTAVGYASLLPNTTGVNNSSLGLNSLRNNTTGNYNTAIGSNALQVNVDGDRNAALGYGAGYNKTGGNDNVYIGYQAIGGAVDSSNEIVIGKGATGNGSNTATYGNSSITSHHFTSGQVNVAGNLAVDTNTLYVDAANNRVGVGTSSPDRNLTVIGDAHIGSSNCGITLSDNSGVASIYGLDAAGTTYKPIELRTGAAGTGFYQDTSGRVGIGTSSPAYALEVVTSSNNPIFANTTGTASNIIFNDSNTTANVTVGSIGNDFRVQAGNAERMRIDSSGNVGIGVSNAETKLDIDGFITLRNAPYPSPTSSVYKDGFIGSDDGTLKFAINGASNGAYGSMAFITRKGDSSDPLTAIFIDEDAQVRIGKTSGLNNAAGLNFKKTNDGGVIVITRGTGSATMTNVSFFNDTGGSPGSITTTNTTVSYNTSSDYRLKENVVPMEGALDRVDALKPSRFNFIADPEKTVDGFLAHEVADVIPEAVTGEKDAVDEEGNPVYQGIDQSKIVPLLVGAIKELSAKVAALESQLNA